jgi:hypothetical protein
MARFMGNRGDAARRKIIEQRLEEAALVDGGRAHALATLILANDGGRVACDLTSFARDCEESEAIIAASQRVTQLLNRLSGRASSLDQQSSVTLRINAVL